jgi:NADPH-dependent 2,4-dienoyl-CoA reductase/sulfur reductase-like enzyme
MKALREATRRSVVGGVAATAASLALPRLARGMGSARIVVIGGGFAGVACARALRRSEPALAVSLVEANRTFTACPFSNEVIAGLREIETQQFGYDRLAADGINVVLQPAVRIDSVAHAVTLANDVTLSYDRLVIAPGIDLRYEALPGFDEAAALRMPHAWKAGEQTLLLRRQLQAMDDGGVVAIAVPANPSRCPPAPYERASLIAHYLKSHKPRSKVLILDAKDGFSQQRLFETAWKELYPGLIERISLSEGGRVTSVDPASRTIITEFGNYTPDVANIIPPQKAGRIADIAGVADQTGWCPIDPVTFESKRVANIHVIGDACLGGALPKSAAAANAQGKASAAAIVTLMSGKAPDPPRLTGLCYNTVAPGYAFSLAGNYQPKDDVFAEVEGGATSPVDAPPEVRKREAEDALTWFKSITVDSFG